MEVEKIGHFCFLLVVRSLALIRTLAKKWIGDAWKDTSFQAFFDFENTKYLSQEPKHKLNVIFWTYSFS
jgi:hypothetical protein